MHAKAMANIRRLIAASIDCCEIENGWPIYSSWATAVNALAVEVVKQKREWISSQDVYFIFLDHIREILEDQKDTPATRLSEVLIQGQLEQLERALAEYFDSIPRQYDVYLVMPNFGDEISEIEISKEFGIKVFDKYDELPEFFSGTGSLLSAFSKTEKRTVFLQTVVAGYCGRGLQTSGVKTAYGSFKTALQQLISKRVLKVEDVPGSLGFFLSSQHAVQKFDLVYVDRLSKKGAKAPLPMDVCRLLEKARPDTDSENWKKAVAAESAHSALKSVLRLPSLLMISDSPEAKRVRAATEWCFDSYVSENQTLAFLQTCIGLEALFGDDTSNGSLTHTLADRCAYLIGNNIKGRNTIRERFKELYVMRSKLVHGNATSLDESDEDFLGWGRTALELSIISEIKHLGLDSTQPLGLA
nr:HEPN domain-containing protein [uncultured Cupriavidus sp.]